MLFEGCLDWLGFWACLLQVRGFVGSPNDLQNSTVIRDVSIKLLLKWFSALWASSSDRKPMKPNFRNLPSLVNFRLQSVSVPKAANSCLKRSSFI